MRRNVIGIALFFIVVVGQGTLYGQKKQPVFAGCASAVIPGLGQFYNGDIFKGCVFLGGSIIAGVLMSIEETELIYDPYFGFYTETTYPHIFEGVILGLGVLGYSVVDAVITANKINKGQGLGLEFKSHNGGIELALSYKFQTAERQH